MFISQQGLSSSIKSFEKELDLTLFDRTARGTVINDNGKRLLPYAEEIVNQYNRMMSEVTSLKTAISNSVRIECDRRFLDCFPPGTEKLVNDTIPEVNLYIKSNPNEKDTMKKLNEGKIDLAIVSGPVDERVFDRIELLSFPYVAIVYPGHTLSHCDKITLSDLRDMDIIITSDFTNMHTNFIERCRHNGFEPHIVLTATDPTHLLYLCMMKCGIGITTTFYSQYLLHDDTTILPIYDGDFSWTIEFIMKKGANICKR